MTVLIGRLKAVTKICCWQSLGSTKVNVARNLESLREVKAARITKVSTCNAGGLCVIEKNLYCLEPHKGRASWLCVGGSFSPLTQTLWTKDFLLFDFFGVFFWGGERGVFNIVFTSFCCSCHDHWHLLGLYESIKDFNTYIWQV